MDIWQDIDLEPAPAPEDWSGSVDIDLEDLPDPDRVFIGGSRGLLAEIIPPCAERLSARGRLVASAVLQNTAEQAPLLMAANGLEADARTISVTREKKAYSDDEQSGLQLNPITIITGKK